MNRKEMLSHVDHTLLKPTSDWAGIAKLCEEAVACGTASVCIPPRYVRARCGRAYGTLNVCTVVGFPLGYSTREVKVFEAQRAVADGADESGHGRRPVRRSRTGDFDAVTEEIRAVKEAVGDRVLKVIVETCYLTQEEKVALCACVTRAGADYIKTSTGFGTAGGHARGHRAVQGPRRPEGADQGRGRHPHGGGNRRLSGGGLRPHRRQLRGQGAGGTEPADEWDGREAACGESCLWTISSANWTA